MASLTIQYRVALVLVCLLGVLWGRVDTSTLSDCVLRGEYVGSIIRTNRHTPQSSQYIVQGETGCTLLVTTPRFPEYQRGDSLHISGKAETIADLPAELAGYGEYLERKEIDATIRFPEIEVQGRRSSWRAMVQQAIRSQIGRIFTEPEAGILVAMVLGDQGMVSEDIEEKFRTTGLTHILSISGLHFSIVAGILFFLFRLLPIPSMVRALATIGCMWLYVALIDFLIPAQRSALLWTFLIIAFEVRALVGVTTIVLLTAVALVSLSPSVLLDISFQLSFAAVIGIGMAVFLTRRQKISGLLSAAAVSLGATATTWPIVSYHFGTVSVITVVANVLAVPAVSLFLLVALTAIAAGFVAYPAGLLGGIVVHMLWLWIEVITRLGAAIPGASVNYMVSIPWLITWYVVLALAFIRLCVFQKRHWREVWE